MEEGRKLTRITRTAKDPVKLRRAIVVLMSGQGQAVRDITSLMQVGEDYVRDVIHAFNERGFDALDHDDGGDGPGCRSAMEDRGGQQDRQGPVGDGCLPGSQVDSVVSARHDVHAGTGFPHGHVCGPGKRSDAPGERGGWLRLVLLPFVDHLVDHMKLEPGWVVIADLPRGVYGADALVASAERSTSVRSLCQPA
jgi:hypothetical protein